MLNKINLAYLTVTSKIKDVLSRKHSGFDGLIIAIGLILVAMIIIIVFKTKIQPVMSNAVDETGNQLNGVVNELTGGGAATPTP